MKRHAVIVATGLALAGLACPALSSPSSGDAQQAKASQPAAIRVAATPKRKTSGGVSTSSGDIDGDGSNDVVVQAPPKPKHKPLRRVRRHR